MDNNNDKQLLEKFKSGDERAFKQIVEETEQRLFLSALKMLKNKEEAEDIVSTAFAIAFKERSKFKGNCSLYTWLWRICFNLCFHHLRKKRQLPFFSLDEMLLSDDSVKVTEQIETQNQPSLLDKFLRDEETAHTRKIVRRAILRLPKKFRQIIILREILDYSYDEITVILEISRGTVMSRLWRAREKLKDILVSEGIVIPDGESKGCDVSSAENLKPAPTTTR